MRYKLDHDLHVHSFLSICSKDPEQTTARILKHACDNKLSAVAVTDHYWDCAVPGASKWYEPQDFAHISQAKPLPTVCGVQFLFGCESEMRKDGVIGIPRSRFSDFDFVIIPTTHLHMRGFTISEQDAASNQRRAEFWVERLDGLLDMDLPFEKVGVAHLACSLIQTSSREEYLNILRSIPESEMQRVFAKASERGVGIELNLHDMSFKQAEADAVLRPFKIAKHQGCRFYLGSDAHHPQEFNTFQEIFERAVGLLGLTEADKYFIRK
jgi:histidinol phosphatase-like PHP family hydrolase